MVRHSKALENLPEYPFAKVGEISRQVEQNDGVRVINVRIGIPDREAPMTIKELLAKYILEKRSTFGYPGDVFPLRGIPELIDAIIQHYDERYGVTLHPENIAVTNWTKGVLHQLARLYAPGTAVIPEPMYPGYVGATILAGHEIRTIPTSKQSGWLPRVQFDDSDVVFYFCDPNNPTGAVADENYYEELLDEIKRSDVGCVFDKAYKDYVFDESTVPISITQIPELLEYGYEVVSFSKHNNLIGIGLGWIVSSRDNIDKWLKLASNFSQGVAWYKQKVGVEALWNPAVKNEIRTYMQELKERRNLFVKGFNDLGFECDLPKATPYLFPRIPEVFGDNDETFALNMLLRKAHVATMPGSYFGMSGRGHLRTTIFVSTSQIKEALRRIEDVREW